MTIRRFTAVIAVLTLAAGSTAAQETGVISGTIIDAPTSSALRGVTVRVTGTAYGAVSRANGSYAILQVPPGIYDVEARLDGYSTITQTKVDVRADVNRVVNFSLVPDGSSQQAARSRTEPANVAEFAQVLGGGEVRLFSLQHLSNADAAKLLAPFVRQPVEGVFDPGDAVRGVTVRGSAATLARIDSLLAVHDRPPTTIVLRFQVIAALDSAVRDPAVGNDLHAALREQLPYAGYRNVAQTLVTSTPGDRFSLVMDGTVEQMRLSGELRSVGTRPTGSGAARTPEVLSASLSVFLRGYVQQGSGNNSWENLVSTALSIPIGQTVVIGNATARSPTSPQHRALILVVRAEAR